MDSWVLLFTHINSSSNMIVHLSSLRCVNSGETINMKLADQLLGVRGVASKAAGRYQGGILLKHRLRPKIILLKKGPI